MHLGDTWLFANAVPMRTPLAIDTSDHKIVP
jgi:hypothetical protein